MKILTLSPIPLYPIRSGLELRIYNMLRPLCDRHEISLLSFAPDVDLSTEELEHLNDLFDIVHIVKPEKTVSDKLPLVKRIYSWFSPSSVTFGSVGHSEKMQDYLNRLLEENSYDLIFVASAFVLNYVLNCQTIPIVFDAIDDTSLLFRREIKHQSSLVGKLRAIKDWLIVRRAEKKLYSKFNEIVLTSPVDAAIMHSLCPRSNITVIPIGVNANSYNGNSKITEKPTMIFTGVMNYEPNVKAMTFFCHSILPLIEKQIPKIELSIVGRNPSEELIALGKSSDRITVTGEVDDLKPYFGSAWVYICPLITGAGIKIKVLEAWLAEIPIVATSLSCEGIDVSPDEDILVADTPVQFAKAVIKLLRDREYAAKLARAGRKKAIEQYDCESKAQALEQLFERAIKQFRRD
ncbi:MAG: glycosyltransferase [candidate division Zixibacteria bacterium]|nr:glycosyltransferase [candidate division Zixibacteria bacterium]